MNRINVVMLVALTWALLPGATPAQPYEDRWERSDRAWGDEDDDWRDRSDRYRARHHRHAPPRHYGRVRIPPGHLPPPGECRLWYVDRPPGHQPPPVPCGRLRKVRHFDRTVIVSHYGVEHVGYGPDWRRDQWDRRPIYRSSAGVEVILDIGGDRGHAHVEYRQKRR